jgi:hypothetical protein
MQWPIKDFREGKLDKYFAKRGSIISVSKLVPKFGIGSRGGGYITECDNCGTVFFTSSLNRHFCNNECRKQYEDRARGLTIAKNPERYDVLHRLCNVCNTQFETTGNQIKKGRGLYCSNKCKYEGIFKRKLFFWRYKCIVCGRVFKYSYPYHYCSVECMKKDNTPRYNKDVILMNVPLLRSRYLKELATKKDRVTDLAGRKDENRYPHIDLYERFKDYIEGKPLNEFDDQSVVLEEFQNVGLNPTIIESEENGEDYENFVLLTRWIDIDYEDEKIYQLPDGSMSHPKTRKQIMRKNNCFSWNYAERRARFEGENVTNDNNSNTVNVEDLELVIEDPRIKVLESGYDYGGFEIPPGSTIDDLRPDCYLKIKPC